MKHFYKPVIFGAWIYAIGSVIAMAQDQNPDELTSLGTASAVADDDLLLIDDTSVISGVSVKTLPWSEFKAFFLTEAELASLGDLNTQLGTSIADGAHTVDTDDQTAAEVSVSTTNFDGNFSNDTSHDTIQELMDLIDEFSLDGGGSVDTTGTPVLNDFARFTDADTLEGRSYAEVRADLDLEVGTDFPALSHTHTESDITDLQSYLLDITGESLSDLSDVTITTIASGELLKWNGTAWINNTLAEAGIQPLDSDLTTWAGITPSANLQTWLGTATLANLNTLMGTSIADGAHTTDTTLNLAGAETITGDWVNTTNPWADNEVSDTLTIGASSTIADGALPFSAAGFSGNLATTDDTLQEVFDALDALSAGGADLVDDLTPQLGGPLDLNGQEIQSSGDVVFQLGDNAGANKLSIQDSDSAEVLYINSNGGLIASGPIYAGSEFRINGGQYGFWRSDYLKLFQSSCIGWSSSAFSANSTTDVNLYRDAAGVLAQRNGTNAQEFRLYETWASSGSDYIRAYHKFDVSNNYLIGIEDGGTEAGNAGGTIVAGSGEALGFYGTTPVAQPSGTGETTGFTAGSGTAVNDDSTFTGNVGSTAYRINDVVKALKQLGILAE